MIEEIQILRAYAGDEWEIPVAYKVEEVYRGTNDYDDPDHCVINERVEVLKDTGPFRVGDLLVLTEEEKQEIEWAHLDLVNES